MRMESVAGPGDVWKDRATGPFDRCLTPGTRSTRRKKEKQKQNLVTPLREGWLAPYLSKPRLTVFFNASVAADAFLGMTLLPKDFTTVILRHAIRP
jgi:hypothetical protein